MAERLTLEETKTYLVVYREQGDKQALEILCEKNRPLVKYIAKKYISTGIPFEELESAGMYGLFRTLQSFDYKTRDIEGFSSYISVAIENNIRYEYRKAKKHSHVLSFEQPIGTNKNGDEMKIEDLVGTDAEQLLDEVIDEMKNEILKEALSCLTSREKQIIFLRYGLDEIHKKTQEELAEMFGCSQSQIVKQEQKALHKMRHPRNTRKLKDFMDL